MCLIDHFEELDDPRMDRKKRHDLTDILVMSICAIISGAEGCHALQRASH